MRMRVCMSVYCVVALACVRLRGAVDALVPEISMRRDPAPHAAPPPTIATLSRPRRPHAA
jgi:hypothetical protein